MQSQKFYLIFIFSIAFVLIIIVGIITFFIFQSPRQTIDNIDTITPTPIEEKTSDRIDPPMITLPESFPTPTKASLSSNSVIKENIVSQMPVQTSTYDIEYLNSSDSFVVTIKESPFETNKQTVQNWFREQGVSNINGLNIFYSRPRFLE